MSKIAIVTDSTSDLPIDLVQQRQISIAPLHILWGAENLSDGIDITTGTFYQRLVRDPILPKTSQPSVGEFAEIFKRVKAEGAEHIVCITISKALSGTYASAEAARDLVNIPVTMVDSRTASVALGLVVLAAADVRDRGGSAAEIAKTAADAGQLITLMFSPNTLDFLHKGGRIGGAQRLIGTALSIKPILHVKDGAVAPLENVRTRKKVIVRMLEIAQERAKSRPLSVAIIHTYADEVQEFRVALESTLKPDRIFASVACPAIGVHIGPAAIGVAVLPGM